MSISYRLITILWAIVSFTSVVLCEKSDLINNPSPQLIPSQISQQLIQSINEYEVNNLGEQQQQQIFINQSNNIYILAKYGQTISLPCNIVRQKHQDFSNIHAVWYKLVEKSRPIVLSIGHKQIRQDMRYRVKQTHPEPNQQRSKNLSADEALVFDEDNEVSRSSRSDELKNNKFLNENWQFEIRRLNYEDSGTYQCLLSLAKPITKNITLQVIPNLAIEPKKGVFKKDEDIMIKCQTTMRTSHHHGKANTAHFRQRQQRPTINWYKDNEMLISDWNQQNQSERRIEIVNSHDKSAHLLRSSLLIRSARLEDAGKYMCTYENSQEQVAVKVSLDQFGYRNFLVAKSSTLISPTIKFYAVLILIKIMFIL